MTAEIKPVLYIPHIHQKYAALGFAPYRWIVNDGPPFRHRLPKPLDQCRLALVGSGGIYQTGQTAFHHKDDISIRLIPKEVNIDDLRVTHFAYDLKDARKDVNIVFPVNPLRRLEKQGVIGELAENFLTCMGGIYSAGRVRRELAPRLTQELLALKADAALFVPVTPVCHQTVGLIARHAEANGISTLCLSSVYDVIRSVNPPRVAFLDYPMGYAAGKPDAPDLQYQIIADALDAFNSLTGPETIKLLSFRWQPDDGWKQTALKHGDTRRPRLDTPQYQCETDRLMAGAL